MNILKAGLFLAAAVIFAAACGQPAAPVNKANAPANTANKVAEVTPAPPAKPLDELAAGKELYTTNCMTCHRDSGKGGKVTVDGKSLDPDDLTTAKMKARSDEKLAGGIREGAPDDGMPAFKGKLTDEQIKSVVTHLRALQGGVL